MNIQQRTKQAFNRAVDLGLTITSEERQEWEKQLKNTKEAYGKWKQVKDFVASPGFGSESRQELIDKYGEDSPEVREFDDKALEVQSEVLAQHRKAKKEFWNTFWKRNQANDKVENERINKIDQKENFKSKLNTEEDIEGGGF